MCRFPQTSPDDDHISADSVARARKKLETCARRALVYANRRIAHRTPRDPDDITLGDIYAAFDEIFDTFGFFHTLLTGGVWTERTPVPQFDWTAVYTIPWATDAFVERMRDEVERQRRNESSAVLNRITSSP